MKKLMSAVLMLFILTTLVPGASAAPYSNSAHNLGMSVSERTNLYTTNTEYLTSTSYASVSLCKKGLCANGYGQSYTEGSAGTYAVSDQAITGTINTATGPNP
jgi:hypothetical protein